MQLSPLTGHGIDAVPIEDTIRGVAVLLDFDQQIAGTEGVKTSCRQKYGVTGFCSILLSDADRPLFRRARRLRTPSRDLVRNRQEERFRHPSGSASANTILFLVRRPSLGGGSFRWCTCRDSFSCASRSLTSSRKARRGGNIAENRLSLLRPQFM